MDLLLKDLLSFDEKDIQKLKKYYNVETIDDIAKCNFLRMCRANMPRGTWHSSQISDVINVLNSTIKSNICLRRALVVTTYTDKSDVWFETMELDIHKQPYDIYTLPSKGIAGVVGDPAIIIQEIAEMSVPRFCFFVIWVKRDGYRRELPVIDSHMTMTLCQRNGEKYNVYKYNSGFFDLKNEELIDMLFLHFLTKVQAKSKFHYDLKVTASWCPRNLQGTTELCTVYAFHIYYYLAKYRQMSITDILNYQQQHSNLIIPFYIDLSKKVKPNS